MAVNVIKRTWSQDRMVRPETLNGMAFQAEAGAHRFEITGYDSNGNVMAFSGSVTAIFLRPDNTDVPLTGVISNGVAQVTLSQECYQVPGRFGLAIFVNSGNTKTVVYKCIGPVGMTSSGVEASSVVQSVNTLIDRIEAAVNSIPQDYSALSKSVSATCPEMRDGSTGNPWNTDSITTKYVIKIDKSCDELILEYIGSTQAQYYVFGYSVFNGVADGTESYAARTSAASFLDYPEKYVQTEPYVIIPVSQLGDYTHIAIVLWAKSDETTFIPLRIATEQNNLRVTFRHAFYMGHEEINNRSVKVGVQNASKMASPLKLVHFSDLHRDVNALNRIRASAKYVCPNADNIICTGDMVANTYAEITSWWVPEIMTCIGNHDTASYDGTYDWTALTMAQRDEMYISPFKSYWGIVHTAGTSYYYKDYTAAHIRLIVMDAMLYSGTPGAEATAQTQWLANLLASAITDSLHVIIAIHAPHGGSVPVACSFTKLGQETMPVNVDCNTPDVVINTVATAIGNGLHFIGYICGHTHQDAVWDCTGDRSQLMYTVTCAAVDQTAQWIDSDQYRTDEQDAFNVLTIDTASTTIKILRGGGANTDVDLRPRVSMVINYSTGKIITDTYASGTQDAVVYGEAQELTDAQKAQARANIGAGSAADVSENTADITANANEITSLKSAIYNDPVTESLDIQIASVGYYINATTGGSSSNSGSAYCDYLAVIPGATVSLDGLRLDGNRSVYGYNQDKSPKQPIISGTSETSATFIVPDGVYWIRATTTNNGTITGTQTINNVKFVAKDQGAANVGKVLQVGNDGKVTLAEIITEIDDTLTQQGVAADAKATGDAIEVLTDDVDEINEYVKHEETNTLSITTTDGSYIDSNGAQKTNANSACTDFIPVTGGAEITLNNVSLNSLRSIVAYSNNNTSAEQKVRLNDGSTFSGSFTVTLPSWAKYVRASTTAGNSITGTEHVVINYINKAIVDAEKASQVAEEIEQTIQDIPGIVSGAISESMMKSACRAVLSRPSGLTLTGLDDVTVFATAASYGVTAKPVDYKNEIITALYIDAVNGDDTNAGIQVEPKKTIQAAITGGADTIYLQDGEYTFPANGISQNINLIGLGSNVVISGGAYFTGNITIYVENIVFDGGAYPCLVEVGAATEKPQFCAYNCTFENSTNYNGLSIKGEATVRVFDCVSRNNYHDGFNYHKNTSISPASGAPNVLECGCEAYGNGGTNSSPTSDNGTTAHNYTQIIRVGGNYHDNHGGNVADNGNVKAWTVGCSASASQKTTGDVNNADFWINASTVMYCDNCYASGSTFDGWAESSSALYVAGGEIENMHTDDTSTKQTYTSEAVFKYLAG